MHPKKYLSKYYSFNFNFNLSLFVSQVSGHFTGWIKHYMNKKKQTQYWTTDTKFRFPMHAEACTHRGRDTSFQAKLAHAQSEITWFTTSQDTAEFGFTHTFLLSFTFTIGCAFSPWSSHINWETTVLVLSKGLESIVTKLQWQARPRDNYSGPHIIPYGLQEQLGKYWSN